MRTRVVVLSLALGVLAPALVGTSVVPDGSRDGQLVFVPVGEIRAEQAGAQQVLVDSCRVTSDGLVVAGHVDPVPDAQVRIAVTGRTSDASGRAVGAGFADAAGLLSSVGSFRATLPWASEDAQFAVAGRLDPSGAVKALGPITSCP